MFVVRKKFKYGALGTIIIFGESLISQDFDVLILNEVIKVRNVWSFESSKESSSSINITSIIVHHVLRNDFFFRIYLERRIMKYFYSSLKIRHRCIFPVEWAKVKSNTVSVLIQRDFGVFCQKVVVPSFGENSRNNDQKHRIPSVLAIECHPSLCSDFLLFIEFLRLHNTHITESIGLAVIDSRWRIPCW